MCIYSASTVTEDFLSEGNNQFKVAECKAFKMGCTLV